MRTHQRLLVTKSAFMKEFGSVREIAFKLDMRDVSRSIEKLMIFEKQFAYCRLEIKDEIALNLLDKLIILCSKLPDVFIDSFHDSKILEEIEIFFDKTVHEIATIILEIEEIEIWNNCLKE
eukprot:NODE_57_length_28844_cov_0.352687.p24 type:complete len:121 gc:universal NODE_57_length_28844_cov_0.352687:26032-25670(-)